MNKLCIIIATVWYDGFNNYFTARVFCGDKYFYIPFCYGYGSQITFEVKQQLKAVNNIDLNEFQVKTTEITVKSKKDMIKN